MIKMIFRIGLLIVLCLPIIYFQSYIIKTTARDVMRNNTKKSKLNMGKKYHTTKGYMNAAK